MKGLNEDEILDFVELTRDKNVDVRYTEVTMDRKVIVKYIQGSARISTSTSGIHQLG